MERKEAKIGKYFDSSRSNLLEKVSFILFFSNDFFLAWRCSLSKYQFISLLFVCLAYILIKKNKGRRSQGTRSPICCLSRPSGVISALDLKPWEQGFESWRENSGNVLPKTTHCTPGRRYQIRRSVPARRRPLIRMRKSYSKRFFFSFVYNLFLFPFLSGDSLGEVTSPEYLFFFLLFLSTG